MKRPRGPKKKEKKILIERLAAVTSAERGKYVAFATLGTLLGPTLSPILGGLISQYAGWHWMYE